MSIRWVESSGQYHLNTPNPGGLYGSTASVFVGSSFPARNGSTYAIGGASLASCPNLGGVGGFSGLIAGYAVNQGTVAFSNNTTYIRFLDNNNNEQCSVRTNGSGQLFFSRNGTALGAGNPTVSTNALPTNAWSYIEFKALFATGATGTCEVRVNGVVWLTLTNVQNATTNAAGWSVAFLGPGSNSGSAFMDMYLLDTANTLITGDNTYLGDVTIAELYPNGAGVNSAWAANPAASFSLTSVNTTGVYQGTITGGASNAYQGMYFAITGFTNGANNVTGVCSASSATSITLVTQANAALTTVSETHAGTATFQNLAQSGIHGGIVDSYSTSNNGTRPNGDVTYYSDGTANDKSDFAHQALSLTGGIIAVVHRSYIRKDDAGTRQIAQICESGGTEEIGATISLGTTYQYYDDILETDPHTAAAWTLTGFNNATFGLKEIS